MFPIMLLHQYKVYEVAASLTIFTGCIDLNLLAPPPSTTMNNPDSIQNDS